jgi:hypothetical protein
MRLIEIRDSKEKQIPYDLLKRHNAHITEVCGVSLDDEKVKANGYFTYEEIYCILHEDKCACNNLTRDAIIKRVDEEIQKYMYKYMDNNVEAKELGLRPCVFDNGFINNYVALFHEWIIVNNRTVALIEFEDGSVGFANPENIKFTDRKN